MLKKELELRVEWSGIKSPNYYYYSHFQEEGKSIKQTIGRVHIPYRMYVDEVVISEWPNRTKASWPLITGGQALAHKLSAQWMKLVSSWEDKEMQSKIWHK